VRAFCAALVALARAAACGDGDEMASEHVNAEGVPLRGDGTPFPEDPSQWSDAERSYLQTYQFGVNKSFELEEQQVAQADVPDVSGGEGGSAIA
jgi:hypothetical protein